MKTESRINASYKKGSQDWKDQLHMLLDDGMTCKDCVHSKRCKTIFGGNDNNTYCQFYPNSFQPAVKEKEES